MNYDPNLTNSGQMAAQTVELTFQMWEFKTTITTQVRGNIMGADVITSALDNVLDDLGGEDGSILLKGENDDLSVDLWDTELGSMMVGARIVSIEPWHPENK